MIFDLEFIVLLERLNGFIWKKRKDYRSGMWLVVSLRVILFYYKVLQEEEWWDGSGGG